MSKAQEIFTGEGYKPWSGRPMDYTCAGCNDTIARLVRGDWAVCPLCAEAIDADAETEEGRKP